MAIMTTVCHFKSNNVGAFGSSKITIRNAIMHNTVEHPDKANRKKIVVIHPLMAFLFYNEINDFTNNNIANVKGYPPN